jgi:glycine oxidase
MSIAVAGGGLIGLVVAWRAAQRGFEVTVIDDAPGTGASFAAAGMLAPVTEASYGEEALLALSRESLARYPSFAAELLESTGLDVGLRTTGTVAVGFDTDDMRALDAMHAFQLELGLAADRLSARAVRDLEPGLSPRVRGGVYVPGDFSVDGRALHAALLSAVSSLSVTLVRDRVSSVLVRDGRAVGLGLSDGSTVEASSVVLALGAWGASLPGAPPVPVRPVKGQILRLRGAAGLVDRTVRALVRNRYVYLVPYDKDGLIVGATVEDRGFDPTVTAGAVHDLLRDAIEVVPGVTELELVETLARWRPGTPDNAPLLGQCELPGLVLATGHYRNGVLLAPVTGDAIAELLDTGSLPAAAAPFGVDRFASDSEEVHSGGMAS